MSSIIWSYRQAVLTYSAVIVQTRQISLHNGAKNRIHGRIGHTFEEDHDTQVQANLAVTIGYSLNLGHIERWGFIDRTKQGCLGSLIPSSLISITA